MNDRSAVADPDVLARYNRAALKSAQEIIGSYSTSFSLATRLLAPTVRRDICNLYAVVRIADEIVDGAAESAGLNRAKIAQLLADYERAVLAAPASGFHTDPVLHAYADTARRCAFNPAHLTAFFAAMRRDLEQTTYDQQGFDEYIYGSAEVIGLLCLAVFLVDHPVSEVARKELEQGARALGAAFQKINFLRDFAEDSRQLGRVYFPGLAPGMLDSATKDELITDIRADLSSARAVMGGLPRSARIGVIAATDLFDELTQLLDALPASAITSRRISVPRSRKLAITAGALRKGLR